MSERPKEGIYLDAALAVIGEQVAERIDEHERRRRRWVRAGVGALALAALAGGSATAIALSATLGDTGSADAASAHTVAAQVRCVEGGDPTATAYFAARYRIAEQAAIDPVASCRAAAQLIAGDATLAALAPEELVATADELLARVNGADAVTVSSAAFGTLAGPLASELAVCTSGEVSVVLSGTAQDDPALPDSCARVDE
ncbi:MAG: hypothetical protein QM677_04415 [Microbacterium sp.]